MAFYGTLSPMERQLEHQTRNENVQPARELLQRLPLDKEFSRTFSRSVLTVCGFSLPSGIPSPGTISSCVFFLMVRAGGTGHQFLPMVRPCALGLRAEHEIQSMPSQSPSLGDGARDGSVTTQRLGGNEMCAATPTEGMCRGLDADSARLRSLTFWEATRLRVRHSASICHKSGISPLDSPLAASSLLTPAWGLGLGLPCGGRSPKLENQVLNQAAPGARPAFTLLS